MDHAGCTRVPSPLKINSVRSCSYKSNLFDLSNLMIEDSFHHRAECFERCGISSPNFCTKHHLFFGPGRSKKATQDPEGVGSLSRSKFEKAVRNQLGFLGSTRRLIEVVSVDAGLCILPFVAFFEHALEVHLQALGRSVGMHVINYSSERCCHLIEGTCVTMFSKPLRLRYHC